MQAIYHTYVDYKLVAIKVGLLRSNDRIYTGSLRQKQAILCLSGLYSEILLMIDALFWWYKYNGYQICINGQRYSPLIR